MEKVIELRDMEHPAENVFGLENPENYHCQVWFYNIGHSILTVRITKKDDTKVSDSLYLMFDSIQFFEGPMWWRGANFCTSTLYDYAELKFALEIGEKLPENFVQDMTGKMESQKSPSHLFTLRVSDKIRVRILAGSVTLTDDLSSWPQVPK